MTPAQLAATGILCGFTLLAHTGEAHRAVGGWTYPPACCKSSDVGGHCEAIPSTNVKRTAQGFLIFIRPADHHLATRYHSFFVPYGDELPSGDENYHICLYPTEDYLTCFFAPPDAV
jgi:hypothetical protein